MVGRKNVRFFPPLFISRHPPSSKRLEQATVAFSSFSFTLSPYATPSCVFPASPYPTPSCVFPASPYLTPSCVSSAFLRLPHSLNAWNRPGKGLRTRLQQVVRTWEHNYNLRAGSPGALFPSSLPHPVPLGTPGELARRLRNITITALVDKIILM